MIRKAVSALPLSAEVKSVITESTEILIEFRNHLMENHGVDEAGAEELLRNHVKEAYKENVDNHPNIGMAVDIIHDFATNEGFEKADELRDAITKMNDVQSSLGI